MIAAGISGIRQKDDIKLQTFGFVDCHDLDGVGKCVSGFPGILNLPEKFGNTITQFVINSTLRFPEKQKKFTPQVVYNSKKNPVGSPADKLWKKLFKGKVDVSLLTSGSGFGILRVSDEGVFVDFHNVDQKPVTLTLRKNK